MKKLTHSESEIVKSVNELEAGVSADEICEKQKNKISQRFSGSNLASICLRRDNFKPLNGKRSPEATL